jgi:hypothetical protein
MEPPLSSKKDPRAIEIADDFDEEAPTEAFVRKLPRPPMPSLPPASLPVAPPSSPEDRPTPYAAFPVPAPPVPSPPAAPISAPPEPLPPVALPAAPRARISPRFVAAFVIGIVLAAVLGALALR